MENDENILSDVSHTSTPEPLDEVQIAMQRLADAKARKALADETRLIAAKTALMDRQAAEEKAMAWQREEQRMIQEKWAAKRKAEKDAEDAEQRAAEEGKRQLAAEVERQEAKKRQEVAKQAEVTRLSEEAFQLEQATSQVEAEVARGISFAAPEPTPVTLNDARHPLSRVFGVTQEVTEPVAQAYHQDAPCEITLRPDSPDEQRALIAVFQNVGGVTLGVLASVNLLRRFTPLQIETSLDYEIQFGKENLAQRVESLLWNPKITCGQ